MITGKENLIQWMRFHKFPIWKLTMAGTGKSQVIAEYDGASIEESIVALESVLSWISPSRYHVSCKETDKQTKGLNETVYIHESVSSHSASHAPAIAGAGYMTVEAAQAMVVKAIREESERREKDELTKQVQALKQELKDNAESGSQKALGLFLNSIQPYTGSIMEQIGLKKAVTTMAISGVTPQERQVEFVDTSEQERCAMALEMWAEADPSGYVDMIEKIASGAKEKPAEYSMYKGMLLGK